MSGITGIRVRRALIAGAMALVIAAPLVAILPNSGVVAALGLVVSGGAVVAGWRFGGDLDRYDPLALATGWASVVGAVAVLGTLLLALLGGVQVTPALVTSALVGTLVLLGAWFVALAWLPLARRVR